MKAARRSRSARGGRCRRNWRSPAARAPDDRWPWQRQGEYWVLRYEPAGPRDGIEPAAYGPTFGMDRGMPFATRRSIVLLAAAFAIVALGLTLWRSRWAVAAVVLLSALVAAGVAAWDAGRS